MGFDFFTVGLRLYDEEDLALTTFCGRSAFANESPFPDWMYWKEYVFDYGGTQGSESKMLAEVLGEMIGVSIVPPPS